MNFQNLSFDKKLHPSVCTLLMLTAAGLETKSILFIFYISIRNVFFKILFDYALMVDARDISSALLHSSTCSVIKEHYLKFKMVNLSLDEDQTHKGHKAIFDHFTIRWNALKYL